MLDEIMRNSWGEDAQEVVQIVAYARGKVLLQYPVERFRKEVKDLRRRAAAET
jgi:hypothetical protein